MIHKCIALVVPPRLSEAVTAGSLDVRHSALEVLLKGGLECIVRGDWHVYMNATTPNLRPTAQALWRETLDSTRAMDETTTVRLVAAFQHVFIRDVLLCEIVHEHIDNAGKVLLGHGGIAPDWARVDKARDIARELIQAAPEGYRAPMLTLIGWLEFYKGRGSTANHHFELATHDTKGYRLAELLSEVIRRGTVAGTAQNPDTAYRPQQ
ncbi:DUF4192 family protein [Arthrobacter sp. ISL-28]|uniref:DUF4192 family protein n=1 Tax=Arthrobacter sp. ISL-28 TaxID=2819108 RepID=UPI001BEAF0F7|nr:DUF4192 family protein [Arthrobacter sp. ISL-28]